MSDELREALTVAGASPLIPKAIDPVLLQYVRRFSPLCAALPDKQWGTNVYYFNQRTAMPQGGAVQDGGARTVTNSIYAQSSFTLKLFQQVGAVTGFAQVVTRDLVGDLKAEEVRASAKNLLWAIETALCWGSAAATSFYPTTDGLDVLVSTYTGTSQNAIDEGHASMTLSMLDNLIDIVEENAASPVQDDSWMLIMSPKANSKVQQLFVAQQRFDNGTMQVAGMNVPAYRGVPIIKSSFLSARSVTQGAFTLAAGGTGGTLATATYFYQVSAIVGNYGETIAAAEVSQAVTSGQNVTITLPAAPSVDGNGPTQYKVYRSTSTGTEVLVGIVEAVDTTGAATATIVDTGAALLTNSSGNSANATSYAAANSGQHPRASGDEDIYLLPRDPDIILRPWTRWMQFINLAPTTSAPDTLPFALVADTCLALRAPKYVGRLSRVIASI